MVDGPFNSSGDWLLQIIDDLYPQENKYADLIEAIEANEFIPDLITLEVDGRGPYNPAGFNDLRAHITIPQKAWKHMLTNITRTVIVESHKI